MRTLRVALAQINATVGDIEGNAAAIVAQIARARDAGADVVCLPELALTGYPPEDLLLRRQFVEDNLRALHDLLPHTQGITAVVGFVDLANDIYNAAAILSDGRHVDSYHKQFLPNYGVFDEDRYFQRGRRAPVYEIAGAKVGVNICEDIWYPGGPTQEQALAGAEVILNINASPFHAGKRSFREKMLGTRAADNTVAVCFVNMVGGQDELVFDGGSMIFDPAGDLVAAAPSFAEDLLLCDIDVDAVVQARLHDSRRRKEQFDFEGETAGRKSIFVSGVSPRHERRTPLPAPNRIEPLGRAAEVYQALVTGTRDYMRKNGFRDVFIALSGGVDSSITAVVAVDALRAEHVTGVSMPSRYSSDHSRSDAAELAQNLGIRCLTLPIEAAFSASLKTLEPIAGELAPGLAEENLQARIRGNYLMFLTNKFNALALTTGNKSEMATGYSTLYGDMAGGFAVIKDVPKTLLYEVCRYRNTLGERPVIPENVLVKEPSAELRPDQKDSDSLPPYEVLDPILEAYVEDDRTVDEIVALGFDEALVQRVITLVNRSEHKRRQAPPGVKITPRAFGRDRRLPIANRYRGY
ncbi:MAG TPA: NAD+ synthase [Dehalococcoidia bacterium]|nr:NAD+ synthase [Dehalococcoidia bacterium]